MRRYSSIVCNRAQFPSGAVVTVPSEISARRAILTIFTSAFQVLISEFITTETQGQ